MPSLCIIMGCSTIRKTSPFFLIIYLLIHHMSICQDGITDSYVIHWITINYLFTGLPSITYLFSSSNCPRFHQWEPLQSASYVLVSRLRISLGTSLLSGIARSSAPSLPSSGISRFSKEPWFLLGGEWYLENKIWVITDWLFFLTVLLLNELKAYFFSVPIILSFSLLISFLSCIKSPH